MLYVYIYIFVVNAYNNMLTSLGIILSDYLVLISFMLYKNIIYVDIFQIDLSYYLHWKSVFWWRKLHIQWESI